MLLLRSHFGSRTAVAALLVNKWFIGAMVTDSKQKDSKAKKMESKGKSTYSHCRKTKTMMLDSPFGRGKGRQVPETLMAYYADKRTHRKMKQPSRCPADSQEHQCADERNHGSISPVAQPIDIQWPKLMATYREACREALLLYDAGKDAPRTPPLSTMPPRCFVENQIKTAPC